MNYRYGKVALVVGASSGVGKECAEYLYSKGYQVYGTSRRAVLPVNQEGIQMLPLDVTKTESIRAAVNYIVEKEHEIDLVINCPGYGLAGAIEDMEISEAKAVFDTNFFGIMDVCREVLPHMRSRKNGLIINISSVAGIISIPFQSMYSASKFALESYTECLRIEGKSFNIKAALIEPGDMHTNFQRNYVKRYNDSSYKERCEKAIGQMIQDEHNGPSAKVVVKELKRILRKKNPPIRVVVGFKYKGIAFLKRVMPGKFVEFVVAFLY